MINVHNTTVAINHQLIFQSCQNYTTKSMSKKYVTLRIYASYITNFRHILLSK